MIRINTNPPVLTDQHIRSFWAKVDKTPGQGVDGLCWRWLGRLDKDGYGMFSTWKPSRGYRASRLSFYLTHGTWPDALACHSCDNPGCVNPECLWDGTPADNARDSVRKGRHVTAVKPETLQGRSRTRYLTDDAVRSIRSTYASGGISQEQLAVLHSVRRQTISRILCGRGYKHVT